MEVRIEIMTEKKFIGKRIMMSLANNKTRELWQGFMSKRKAINNRVGLELYSIENYPPGYFEKYSPDVEFEKWAAVEVSDTRSTPDEMDSFMSPEGLYAVFVHKGPASGGPKTYQHIFMTWLPSSNYILDNRPHFAIMGVKYRNEDDNSEEELWIPVKAKGTPAANVMCHARKIFLSKWVLRRARAIE